MKKLAVSLVSLGLLASSFSAVSATEYQCDSVDVNLATDKVVMVLPNSSRVIITDKEILYGMNNHKLFTCGINVRSGEYIGNKFKECFFNKKENHFMITIENHLISLENCKKVKQ